MDGSDRLLHPEEVGCQAVLLMSEFLPVTCICTEYIVFLKVTRIRLNQAAEDFELMLEEALRERFSSRLQH